METPGYITETEARRFMEEITCTIKTTLIKQGVKIIRIISYQIFFKEVTKIYKVPMSRLQKWLGMPSETIKGSTLMPMELWMYCELGEQKEIILSVPWSKDEIGLYLLEAIETALQQKGLIAIANDISNMKVSNRYKKITSCSS